MFDSIYKGHWIDFEIAYLARKCLHLSVYIMLVRRSLLYIN